ncbi:MAG TPA: radical SAM protein, partial [Pontiellaceae bacterium]|nr:radical SAM protein [Pontiellaceae bacterium]HPR83016.1 radical SAM protein [Pontiellaceae bacterium]
MLGISKLYLDNVESSDELRYGLTRRPASVRRPIVVWNCTQFCNLECAHCYARSDATTCADELTTAQAKKMIDEIASFGCPVLLFSGGEPLVRKDVPELAEYARAKGLRAVISTNGTLIDRPLAGRLQKIGLSYVGISIDGTETTHDLFRCKKGAFQAALRGIRNCRDAGLKVGLRFTLVKDNIADIPAVFDLMEAENIPRICFYHLVNTGRGEDLNNDDGMPSHEATRAALELIIKRTAELHAKGKKVEVLTVDNHSDGPWLLRKMRAENHPDAAHVYDLLKLNGGAASGSGVGISCISWNGDVYPDQFWRSKKLGNVLKTPFGEIWTDPENEFLQKLKKKAAHVTGRCADCQYLELCGGNFRARAEASTGDLWAPDPACYLTDEEIHGA